MTEQADRELLATVIMGWEKRVRDAWGSDWVNSEGVFECETIDWHPDQGIEQAMQIVDAIKEKPFSVRKRFMTALNVIAGREPRETFDINVFWWFLFIADRPRVIFKAAVAVAKAMKGEGS